MTRNRPNPDPSRWPGAHPDFDGHLEKRVQDMTDAERLRWIWEGTLLLHWARHKVRLHPPSDAPRKSSPNDSGQ